MKSKFAILMLLLAVSFFCKGAITSKVFTLNGYGSYNVLIYTPDNNQSSYPTMFFIPGNGESTRNIQDLYRHGPFYFINRGWRPNFMVVAFQPFAGGPVGFTFTEHALNTAINDPSLKIHPTNWGMTGLSYGAAAIFIYIRNTPSNRFLSPKFIVPFSITIDAACGNFYDNSDYLCGNDFRYQQIRSWGLCGYYDSHFQKMKRFFQRQIEAGYPAKWTTYGTSNSNAGHCCWNTCYDPNWKENGMSIYDFAMNSFSLPVTISHINFRSNFSFTELYWGTITESDNSHFIVEESDDAVNWKEVGQVKTKAEEGNSSLPLNYSFKISK